MIVKILIVDDERRIADTLCEIVEAAGYEAVAKYSPQEALATAASFQPDILLTHVLMPKMNELALEIKGMWPACRLILFSGQAATAQLAQQFATPFSVRGLHFELLPKPVHPEALLEQIKQTMTHSR